MTVDDDKCYLVDGESCMVSIYIGQVRSGVRGPQVVGQVRSGVRDLQVVGQVRSGVRGPQVVVRRTPWQ